MMYEESEAFDRFAWRDAWEPVLDAIEAAMDVPGLYPKDRAALSLLHDEASEHTSRKRIRLCDLSDAHTTARDDLYGPDGLFGAAGARYEAAYQLAQEPGGTNALGLSWQILGPLCESGIGTIEELAEAHEDGRLISIHGIGPTGVRKIGEALTMGPRTPALTMADSPTTLDTCSARQREMLGRLAIRSLGALAHAMVFRKDELERVAEITDDDLSSWSEQMELHFNVVCTAHVRKDLVEQFTGLGLRYNAVAGLADAEVRLTTVARMTDVEVLGIAGVGLHALSLLRMAAPRRDGQSTA